MTLEVRRLHGGCRALMYRPEADGIYSPPSTVQESSSSCAGILSPPAFVRFFFLVLIALIFFGKRVAM